MKGTLAFVAEYLVVNLKAQLEYRASFVGQILGMGLNNGLWLVFWALYFERFPVVKGWALTDLLTLWSVLTVSVGIVWGFLPNARRIPELALQGQLDYYLTLPRSPLLHLSVSHMSPLNVGDVVFGIVLFFWGAGPTLERTGAFLLMVFLACLIWYGFMVLAGSLFFFLGTAQGFADEACLFLVHFSTYPGSIFGPKTRMVLMTLLPALLVSTTPVEFIREPSWGALGAVAAGAALFLGLGLFTFSWGLRRYESGNAIAMRG